MNLSGAFWALFHLYLAGCSIPIPQFISEIQNTPIISATEKLKSIVLLDNFWVDLSLSIQLTEEKPEFGAGWIYKMPFYAYHLILPPLLQTVKVSFADYQENIISRNSFSQRPPLRLVQTQSAKVDSKMEAIVRRLNGQILKLKHLGLPLDTFNMFLLEALQVGKLRNRVLLLLSSMNLKECLVKETHFYIDQNWKILPILLPKRSLGQPIIDINSQFLNLFVPQDIEAGLWKFCDLSVKRLLLFVFLVFRRGVQFRHLYLKYDENFAYNSMVMQRFFTNFSFQTFQLELDLSAYVSSNLLYFPYLLLYLHYAKNSSLIFNFHEASGDKIFLSKLLEQLRRYRSIGSLNTIKFKLSNESAVFSLSQNAALIHEILSSIRGKKAGFAQETRFSLEINVSQEAVKKDFMPLIPSSAITDEKNFDESPITHLKITAYLLPDLTGFLSKLTNLRIAELNMPFWNWEIEKDILCLINSSPISLKRLVIVPPTQAEDSTIYSQEFLQSILKIGKISRIVLENFPTSRWYDFSSKEHVTDKHNYDYFAVNKESSDVKRVIFDKKTKNGDEKIDE